MMDFEILKLKEGKYAMQVQHKFYEVPHKYRNLNRIKLMVIHERGETKELAVPKQKGL